MSNAYYWFNSKTGPRKGALVRKDGSLVHLDFTNRADTVKVRDTQDVVGTVTMTPKTGLWSGEARNPMNGGTVWVSDQASVDDAAQALLGKVQAVMDAEAALTADPVAHLEREIKTHDWYADMSDSYGTSLAGDRHWNAIRKIMGTVPVDTARALFTKHAPADFMCPL